MVMVHLPVINLALKKKDALYPAKRSYQEVRDSDNVDIVLWGHRGQDPTRTGLKQVLGITSTA